MIAIVLARNAVAQTAVFDSADLIPSHRIQFPSSLRADFEQMLHWSATFRAQYQRLAAAPLLVVGIQIDRFLCGTNVRAHSTIRVYRSGLRVVPVVIGPDPHPAEWIAHEFEHILEQLDGRDLRTLARAHEKDVWYSGEDLIETGRAIRAGRAVRDELRQRESR